MWIPNEFILFRTRSDRIVQNKSIKKESPVVFHMVFHLGITALSSSDIVGGRQTSSSQIDNKSLDM